MRKFVVKVDGVAYDVEVEEVGGVATAEVVAPKVEVKAPVKKAEAKPVAKTVPVGNGVKLTAPLPGKILSLKVASGTAVKKGQVVMVLEAMKMENDVVANADGTITFAVSQGADVQTGTVLATIA